MTPTEERPEPVIRKRHRIPFYIESDGESAWSVSWRYNGKANYAKITTYLIVEGGTLRIPTVTKQVHRRPGFLNIDWIPSKGHVRKRGVDFKKIPFERPSDIRREATEVRRENQMNEGRSRYAWEPRFHKLPDY